MPLYDRLLGRNDSGVAIPSGKIAVHGFQALMAEVARTRLTPAQASARIPTISDGPLVGGEGAEATALLNTITTLGNATLKLARAKEIDDVLLLAEAGVAGYATPTEVKARLGVS